MEDCEEARDILTGDRQSSRKLWLWSFRPRLRILAFEGSSVSRGVDGELVSDCSAEPQWLLP